MTQLPKGVRASLFRDGRAIHKTIGNLFQNDYNMTSDMFDQEITHINNHLEQIRLYKLRVEQMRRMALKEEAS